MLRWAELRTAVLMVMNMPDGCLLACGLKLGMPEFENPLTPRTGEA